MHHALKLASAVAAFLLSACGGSGSEAPSPPAASAPYQATLIAGQATPVYYDQTDQEPGCVDGPALGAKLNPNRRSKGFTRSANGDLLLAEGGYCDLSYRIRVIHPAGNTIKTLAVGTPYRDNDTEPLTTFLTPTSLAVAPSGDIYIGDSDVFEMNSNWGQRYTPGRGPGIWKLGVDGNISVLAGVSLPMGTLDGVGAAASFQFIGAMCYGSDGLLYVNDQGRLRTISTDGTVTTVTGQSVVACGTWDGSVLVYRDFSDSTKSDFYDPIAQKSIAKTSVSGLSFGGGSLLYFGPNNPSVVVQLGNSNSSWLTVVNLVDGSSARVAKVADTVDSPMNLAVTPPVIPAMVIAAVATSGTDFDLLTDQSVIRFTHKR